MKRKLSLPGAAPIAERYISSDTKTSYIYKDLKYWLLACSKLLYILQAFADLTYVFFPYGCFPIETSEKRDSLLFPLSLNRGSNRVGHIWNHIYVDRA